MFSSMKLLKRSLLLLLEKWGTQRFPWSVIKEFYFIYLFFCIVVLFYASIFSIFSHSSRLLCFSNRYSCYQEAVARAARLSRDDDDDAASACGQDSVGNVTCGICMDNVYAKSHPKDRRFGLLPNCSHSFCEACILTWRHMTEYSLDVVKYVSPTLNWSQTIKR